MNINNIMASDSYLIINKELIRKIGLNEALVLSELCNQFYYWEREGKLINNMFYSSQENISNNVGLSKRQVSDIVHKLEDLNLVKTEIKGMPGIKHYEINLQNLFNAISSNDCKKCSYMTAKNDIISLQKTTLNNNKNNNKNINKKEITKEKSEIDLFGETVIKEKLSNCSFIENKKHLLENDCLIWDYEIYFKNEKLKKQDFSDYCIVINFWLDNFTDEVKTYLMEKYNKVRFESIREEFLKWIETKQESTYRKQPYKTLEEFYKRKVTSNQYLEAISQNPSEIINNPFKWDKELVISAFKGTKEDYEKVVFKWLKEMPKEVNEQLIKDYELEDVSTIKGIVYDEAMNSSKRIQELWKVLNTKLKNQKLFFNTGKKI